MLVRHDGPFQAFLYLMCFENLALILNEKKISLFHLVLIRRLNCTFASTKSKFLFLITLLYSLIHSFHWICLYKCINRGILAHVMKENLQKIYLEFSILIFNVEKNLEHYFFIFSTLVFLFPFYTCSTILRRRICFHFFNHHDDHQLLHVCTIK